MLIEDYEIGLYTPECGLESPISAGFFLLIFAVTAYYTQPRFAISLTIGLPNPDL